MNFMNFMNFKLAALNVSEASAIRIFGTMFSPEHFRRKTT